MKHVIFEDGVDSFYLKIDAETEHDQTILHSFVNHIESVEVENRIVDDYDSMPGAKKLKSDGIGCVRIRFRPPQTMWPGFRKRAEEQGQ